MKHSRVRETNVRTGYLGYLLKVDLDLFYSKIEKKSIIIALRGRKKVSFLFRTKMHLNL